MFYNPSISPNLVPLSQDERDADAEWFSDAHKDAFGCRPRRALDTNLMGAAIEMNAIALWSAEDQRIAAMRTEVARFDFSRRMEYLMRRGAVATSCEAFQMTIRLAKVRSYPNDELPTWDEVLADASHYDWDLVAMDCGLPQSDGAVLKAFWESQQSIGI